MILASTSKKHRVYVRTKTARVGITRRHNKPNRGHKAGPCILPTTAIWDNIGSHFSDSERITFAEACGLPATASWSDITASWDETDRRNSNLVRVSKAAACGLPATASWSDINDRIRDLERSA